MVSSSSSPSSSSRHWPPGFRFRPTDQELVSFYLTRKVHGRPIQAGVITEVDLYKCEPWDLPDKSSFENDVEWYFFSPRDKKYPNGSRTNRATVAGYWKATGKDRVVRCVGKASGMKKTLVFYKGRAPHGQRTDWIMHEYRLDEGGKHAQDPFVVCRVFRKTNPSKNEEEAPVPSYADEDVSCWSPVAADCAAAPSEADEGQVCSPPSPPSPPPVKEPPPPPAAAASDALPAQEAADDSLDAFLMMLLEEPDQLVVGQDNNNNTVPVAADVFGNTLFDGDNSFNEAEMIEQLHNCLQQQAPPDEEIMGDILVDDYLELNDLLPLQQVQNNHSPPVSPSSYLDQTYGAQDYTKAATWKADGDGGDGGGGGGGMAATTGAGLEMHKPAMSLQPGDQKQRQQSVKRFLGMLGSLQVLPASAAEEQHKASPSSFHMDVHVTAVTITCECPEVTVAKRRKQRQYTPLQRNLLFVFLVGTMSALFWILFVPLCRLVEYRLS